MMTLPNSIRRRVLAATLAGTCGLFAPSLLAASADGESIKALKEALNRGAAAAVEGLGRPDGFFANDRVRIPLPEKVSRAEKTLRRLGGGKYADQLVEAMNRAAEAAVVDARPILLQAVRQMTVDDALGIVKGSDDAATRYFRQVTGDQLTDKLRPLVEAATQKVGVARKYEKLAGKASQLGLINAADADLDAYITGKTLDGLFLMIAEEEKAIRQNPVATGSALIKKVFGDLLK